eukprot:scaffold499_cov335-Pavlova_lutheri.AAC.27
MDYLQKVSVPMNNHVPGSFTTVVLCMPLRTRDKTFLETNLGPNKDEISEAYKPNSIKRPMHTGVTHLLDVKHEDGGKQLIKLSLMPLLPWNTFESRVPTMNGSDARINRRSVATSPHA